jgi:hypothetical protein
MVGLASSYRLQLVALREELWHDDDNRHWGSVYDFKRKLLRFIERTEVACQQHAGAAAAQATQPPRVRPLRLITASPVAKQVAMDCMGYWRGSLAALGPVL